METILVIDQGTTSTRAILFGTRGEILQQQQLSLTQHYPENGWVEHDPEEIWQSTLKVCRYVIENYKFDNEIIGVGITNQRETTLLWNKQTGEVLHRAIVWQDRRTANFCNQLKQAGHQSWIIEKTGLVLDPYFSASKLHWLLENIAGARQLAERGELAFGTIDTFLLWRLTNGRVHATDITNASRTLLLNIKTGAWDKELLDFFNIPAVILPTVKPNCADFGIVATEHFGRALPIVAMAGDQQSALIGQTGFDAGSIKSTYGTGCFVLLNTGEECVAANPLLTTVAYEINQQRCYAIEGSIFAAGSIVQWLRDNLKLIQSASESEKLAASLPNNHGVYFVPAFTGLGAPYWNPEVRGAMFGLTRDTGPAHIVRAALESIGYQTLDLINAMAKLSGTLPKELDVDGGMSVNAWLMQFLADILQLPVVRAKMVETTALGAAYLAGLQTGIYNSFAEIKAIHQTDAQFVPQMDKKQQTVLYRGWQKAVARLLAKEDDF